MQTEQVFATRATRLEVHLARSEREILAAQRLRWKVFVEEQGARIASPVPGYDIDDLDAHCEHLVAVDTSSALVVGTYRLLTAEAAARAGGYYSEREFDIGMLKQPGMRLLELGRSCVLPAYRNGATIAMLWSGLVDFLIESGHDALIGCASISLKDDRAAAAQLALMLSRAHEAPAELRVEPMVRLPHDARSPAGEATRVPPLIKGYLRSGAVVCGEPCWDPDFDCADLLLYLSLDKLVGRYARHFLPKGRPRIRHAESHPCHAIAVQ
jgi:putative hemolysin